jgi:Fur family transcriptional regulator, zinc uptake regulator
MTDMAPASRAHEHDHQSCVANAVSVATELCQRRGVRLTALRQRVLELVWHSHAPIGAYDILDRLRVEDGRLAAPPTVYRALEFLMQQKLIHRIESLNAFVGCIDPSRPHSAQYLICRACGTVTELEDSAVAEAIAGQAARQGFSIDRQTVEVHGLCGHCAKAARAEHAHAS